MRPAMRLAMLLAGVAVPMARPRGDDDAADDLTLEDREVFARARVTLADVERPIAPLAAIADRPIRLVDRRPDRLFLGRHAVPEKPSVDRSKAKAARRARKAQRRRR